MDSQYQLLLQDSKHTEEALIGSILIDGEAYDRVSDIITRDDFASDELAEVWTAMEHLRNAGSDIDLVTVAQRCKGKVPMERLVNLSSLMTSSANIESYALAMNDSHARRTIVKVATDLISTAADNSVTMDDILGEAERRIREIGEGVKVDNGFKSAKDLIRESLDQMYRRNEMRRNGVMVTGITTGLARLDSVTGGWHAGELIVVGARPAMGKTAMMLHFARAASAEGKSVCIFSLEMSAGELSDRNLVSVSNVSSDGFRRGEMSDYEVETVERSVDTIAASTIYINDRGDAGMGYIRRKSKRMNKAGKCDIVCIDYLQLIRETGNRDRNREQAVAAISREAKIMAKDLGVPVVLLAQLSRECEKRADKKPELSDLRESGAIEQDADKVMFLYRPGYYGLRSDDGFPMPADLGYILLKKNRRGPTADIAFRYNESLTRITDY